MKAHLKKVMEKGATDVTKLIRELNRFETGPLIRLHIVSVDRPYQERSKEDDKSKASSDPVRK